MQHSLTPIHTHSLGLLGTSSHGRRNHATLLSAHPHILSMSGVLLDTVQTLRMGVHLPGLRGRVALAQLGVAAHVDRRRVPGDHGRQLRDAALGLQQRRHLRAACARELLCQTLPRPLQSYAYDAQSCHAVHQRPQCCRPCFSRVDLSRRTNPPCGGRTGKATQGRHTWATQVLASFRRGSSAATSSPQVSAGPQANCPAPPSSQSSSATFAPPVSSSAFARVTQSLQHCGNGSLSAQRAQQEEFPDRKH